MKAKSINFNGYDSSAIVNLLSMMNEDDLIEKFRNNASRQVSISRALRETIGDLLYQNGWQKNVEIDKYNPNRLVSSWKFENFLPESNTYLDTEFGHAMGVGRKLLKALKLGLFDNQASYILIMIGDDLKLSGNFDSSVGTSKLAVDYFAEFEDYFKGNVAVIELGTLESFKVISDLSDSNNSSQIIIY